MSKELKLNSSFENIKVFSNFISEELKAPTSVVSKVLIACDEVLSNIVEYAQSDYICVSIESDSSSVSVTFTDNGKAFDPLKHKDPDIQKNIQHKIEGGLGIYLVKKMMDEVSYKRTDTENHLMIKKNY